MQCVLFRVSLEGSKRLFFFFRKGKKKAACLPLSEQHFHLFETGVVPFLLPVYLKAGVVDINAEFPSGSSPRWEECKVDKQT